MLWTNEQVENLQRRQSNPMMHPYTCGICSKDLRPTLNGWVCEEHGLVQTWAQKEDLDSNGKTTLYG